MPITVARATVGVYTVMPRLQICRTIYVAEARHLTVRLLNLERDKGKDRDENRSR